MNTQNNQIPPWPTPPDIDGLTLHAYHGEQDLKNILIISEQLQALGLHNGGLTLPDLENEYSHLTNCDLDKDFLLAEVNGQPVGYLQRWWESVISDKTRVQLNTFFMLPQWTDSPLGDYFVKWAESRARQLVDELPDVEGRNRIDFWTREADTAKVHLYEKHGFTPLRYYFGMSRSLEGDLPDQPLPEGFVVRPLFQSELRKVWDAAVEAFEDEWGATEVTEENCQQFMGNSNTTPALWQIAWDGDEVAGMVMNYIDLTQNDQEKRHRGYTEGISVRRPYRGKGVASALIYRSMRMFKALNMTEVALGVDAESPTGALGLYTRLGYQTYRTYIAYAKPLT